MVGRLKAGPVASGPTRHPEPQAKQGGIHEQGFYRVSERVVIHTGDRIRVSAGPYYETSDDSGNLVKTKLAERGVLVFLGYCELGPSKWLVAYGKGGYAALHVGEELPSATIPGLIRRPYKVRKLRVPKARRKAMAPARCQVRARNSTQLRAGMPAVAMQPGV